VARSLVIFASWLSLTLCVSAFVLWIRSYFHQDDLMQVFWLEQRGEERTYYVSSWFGEFSVATHFVKVPPADWRRFVESAGTSPGLYNFGQPINADERREIPMSLAQRFGFPYRFGVSRRVAAALGGVGRVEIQRAWAPLWLFTLMFAILPSSRLIGRLRLKRRSRHGLCPTCGYDLRGSPNACPECGIKRDTSQTAVKKPGQSRRTWRSRS